MSRSKRFLNDCLMNVNIYSFLSDSGIFIMLLVYSIEQDVKSICVGNLNGYNVRYGGI